MTREYGEGTANIAGEANEIYGDLHHDQPDWEKNMDRWNNATGREIGQSSSSSQETAQRVIDALRRGDLIADPHTDRDRKSTRLNSSHYCAPRMPSSA